MQPAGAVRRRDVRGQIGARSVVFPLEPRLQPAADAPPEAPVEEEASAPSWRCAEAPNNGGPPLHFVDTRVVQVLGDALNVLPDELFRAAGLEVPATPALTADGKPLPVREAPSIAQADVDGIQLELAAGALTVLFGNFVTLIDRWPFRPMSGPLRCGHILLGGPNPMIYVRIPSAQRQQPAAFRRAIVQSLVDVGIALRLQARNNQHDDDGEEDICVTRPLVQFSVTVDSKQLRDALQRMGIGRIVVQIFGQKQPLPHFLDSMWQPIRQHMVPLEDHLVDGDHDERPVPLLDIGFEFSFADLYGDAAQLMLVSYVPPELEQQHLYPGRFLPSSVAQHPMVDQLHGENYGWLLLKYDGDYLIQLVRVYSPVVHAVKQFFSKMGKNIADENMTVRELRRRIQRFEQLLHYMQAEIRPHVCCRLRFEVRLSSALASDPNINFNDLVRNWFVFTPHPEFPGLRPVLGGGWFRFLVVRLDACLDLARRQLEPLRRWIDRWDLDSLARLPFLVTLQWYETLESIGYCTSPMKSQLFRMRRQYSELRRDAAARSLNEQPLLPLLHLRFLLNYSASDINAFAQCERRACLGPYDPAPRPVGSLDEAWALANDVLQRANIDETRISDSHGQDPLEPMHSWCWFYRQRPTTSSQRRHVRQHDRSHAVGAGFLPGLDGPLAARQLLALLIVEAFGRDWQLYVQCACTGAECYDDSLFRSSRLTVDVGRVWYCADAKAAGGTFVDDSIRLS